MASLGRVKASQGRWLGRVESNARGAMIGRLLFRVSSDETRVHNSYRVRAWGTSTGRPNTARICATQNCLTAWSKHSLQERSSVFLARGLVLLLEAD